jgi:hypothetical protein
MTFDKNRIIFYAIIISLFYIFSEGGMYISSVYPRINSSLVIMLFSGLFAFVMYFTINSNLNKNQRDNFHFQVTPEKLCDGGAYMYSSNPARQELCKSFSAGDLAKYECCPGFHGRPVWWSRSDESNADWANTMCDSGLKDFENHVL